MPDVDRATRRASTHRGDGGYARVGAAAWRARTYSGQGGSHCVEVAAAWRTSTYSGHGGSHCVEVADNLADRAGFVLVRDTKDRTGPILRFPRHRWEAFTAAVRADEFDR